MKLRASVAANLARYGIAAAADDTASTLRDKLNDHYLAEVRQLKAKQKAGEIPLRSYARVVETLKDQYPLLGLPLRCWTE